jgi:hypothetical protein
MDNDRSYHEQIRGLKKAQVRALWQPPAMTDEETRAALSGFSAGLREMGFTGPGSPAEVYREVRLDRELHED